MLLSLLANSAATTLEGVLGNGLLVGQRQGSEDFLHLCQLKPNVCAGRHLVQGRFARSPAWCINSDAFTMADFKGTWWWWVVLVVLVRRMYSVYFLKPAVLSVP